jgi:methionyl-tRNA formyltransferase
MSNILVNKKILFCGSSELSIGVLEFLKSQNIFPHTIITQPARPVGRKKVLTETVVSDWVQEENLNERNIKILKPEKIDSIFLDLLRAENFELCLVASYGKILKQEFLDIFAEGVWNVHPSKLPLYRGATPLQAQIIDGLKEIEVTVIKMDAGMDSGDILASEKMSFDWENLNISELEMNAGFLGGKIFFENFPTQKGTHTSTLQKQDHTKATFTKILKKEDGDVTKEILNIKENIYKEENLKLIWQKYNAYKNWPGIYFIRPHLASPSKGEEPAPTMRIKITSMAQHQILKLLPESKKEISITDFENSYGKVF